MDRLSSGLAAILVGAARLLPPPQRAWGEAMRAEAEVVPPGWARLSWLAGALWTVAREAVMVRRIGATFAGLIIGAVLLWFDWHPGSANPAMPANRVTLAVTVLVLVVLPWLAGPVADNKVARFVRTGGYVLVFAMLTVLVGLSRFAGSRFDQFKAFDQANWEADMRAGAIFSAVLIIATFATYGGAILALTSRRAAVTPATLGIGCGAGAAIALLIYALMPFGNPRHISNGLLSAAYGLVVTLVPLGALVLVGFLARRTSAFAGLCAGGTAALLLAVLTIGTMVLLPDRVDLLWANPDPNAPHGTLFELQMTVGDTSIKYQAGLIFGPIIGLVLAMIGGGAGQPTSSTTDATTQSPDNIVVSNT
jgi:hypothetical protein